MINVQLLPSDYLFRRVAAGASHPGSLHCRNRKPGRHPQMGLSLHGPQSTSPGQSSRRTRPSRRVRAQANQERPAAAAFHRGYGSRVPASGERGIVQRTPVHNRRYASRRVSNTGRNVGFLESMGVACLKTVLERPGTFSTRELSGLQRTG